MKRIKRKKPLVYRKGSVWSFSGIFLSMHNNSSGSISKWEEKTGTRSFVMSRISTGLRTNEDCYLMKRYCCAWRSKNNAK